MPENAKSSASGMLREVMSEARTVPRNRKSTMEIFFFKQKTAYEIQGDWSSDVCSSDLSTAVHRNRVSLVPPGGEVADHGEGCVASEARQRRDGARQIQRRGERDGCPVDQSEGAYRIGLAGVAGLGRQRLRVSAAMRLGSRQVATPGRHAAPQVERGEKNLRAAVQHGQQPIRAAVLFGGCGGEEGGERLADAGGRSERAQV